MFRKLGSDAREILGVVAFFPQGVDEKNLNWFFPAISNRADVFDKFCILSLAYRSEGFVKMLAPLRDYLSPKDPLSSPLLRTTKDSYLDRLVDPADQEGTDWIVSEDVNVEHMLDVFTFIDPNSENVWYACGFFIQHLQVHKPRLIVLGPKIERLPDDHPSKPHCLFHLSMLFGDFGKVFEQKQLLIHAIKLWKDGKELDRMVQALVELSIVNWKLKLYDEAIKQAKEATVLLPKHIKNPRTQILYSIKIAASLVQCGQVDAAEEIISHVVVFLQKNEQPSLAALCHGVIGSLYYVKGDGDKAIEHLERTARINSSRDTDRGALCSHYALGRLSCETGRFGEANHHYEQVKSRAANNPLNLALAMKMQGEILFYQNKFEEAELEITRAADAFKKLEAAREAEQCLEFIGTIRAGIDLSRVWNGERRVLKFLGMLPLPALIGFNSSLARYSR